jgi:DNA-directed RNA polymerase specialized sigma24 family protein
MQNIAAQTNRPCVSGPFRLNAMPSSYLEKSAAVLADEELSRPSPVVKRRREDRLRRRLRSSAPRSTVFLQCPQTTTHKTSLRSFTGSGRTTMASGASPSSSRLNSVDRHGRQIDPAVLAAAEAVFPRALEHGVNLLGDPAVVANTLEEVAATVSRLFARRSVSGEAPPIRNLAGYVFRAFLRHLNRLKRKELVVLDAAIAGQTLAQRSADPSRQLEMKILVDECLAQFDFTARDMCSRRLAGFAWDEIGKIHGLSGHAAEVRFRRAVRRIKAKLAKGKKS